MNAQKDLKLYKYNMKYIKKVDQFGVNFKARISIDDNEQRSYLGGMVTITLYSICAAYFLYVLIQWQIGKILPGTSSISKAVNYQSYTFHNNDLIEFSYWRYSNDLIDPFDPQNIIVLPLAVRFINGIPQDPISLLTDSNKTSIYNSRMISMNELLLAQNVKALTNQDELPIQEVLLVLANCDPSFLYGGQKCGSSDDIDKFWEQAVQYMSFWIKLKQFNIYTKETETVNKQIYMPIARTQNTNGQFIFKPVQLTADDGFLFENQEFRKYLSDVNVLTTSTPLKFFNKILGFDSYFSIFLRIDPIVEEVQVTYPKLGQILAEVGSISSTLLFIKYLILRINNKILERRLLRRIVQIYYPNITTNIDCFASQNTIKRKLRQKLVVTNIIKDIAKIQQFIEFKYGRCAIHQSRESLRLTNQYQKKRSSGKLLSDEVETFTLQRVRSKSK
ncbi:hypothetical protein pb186bvf_016678 [Paramecium bursaria]